MLEIPGENTFRTSYCLIAQRKLPTSLRYTKFPNGLVYLGSEKLARGELLRKYEFLKDYLVSFYSPATLNTPLSRMHLTWFAKPWDDNRDFKMNSNERKSFRKKRYLWWCNVTSKVVWFMNELSWNFLYIHCIDHQALTEPPDGHRMRYPANFF